MKIYPAIDIINGKCVRLTQGDYQKEVLYSENPLAMAQKFEIQGAKYLHIVDLDAASGKKSNYEVIKNIANDTQLKMQVGGGIVNEDQIKNFFDLGIERVIIGSMAIKRKEEVYQWIQKFGNDRIVIGADVKCGNIAINGWKEVTQISILEFIKAYIQNGAARFLCTQIENDGMLSGIDDQLYSKILYENKNIKLIASGGVAGMEDIRTAQKLNLEAIVIGKALYENKIDCTTIFNL